MKSNTVKEKRHWSRGKMHAMKGITTYVNLILHGLGFYVNICYFKLSLFMEDVGSVWSTLT